MFKKIVTVFSLLALSLGAANPEFGDVPLWLKDFVSKNHTKFPTYVLKEPAPLSQEHLAKLLRPDFREGDKSTITNIFSHMPIGKREAAITFMESFLPDGGDYPSNFLGCSYDDSPEKVMGWARKLASWQVLFFDAPQNQALLSLIEFMKPKNHFKRGQTYENFGMQPDALIKHQDVQLFLENRLHQAFRHQCWDIAAAILKSPLRTNPEIYNSDYWHACIQLFYRFSVYTIEEDQLHLTDNKMAMLKFFPCEDDDSHQPGEVQNNSILMFLEAIFAQKSPVNEEEFFQFFDNFLKFNQYNNQKQINENVDYCVSGLARLARLTLLADRGRQDYFMQFLQNNLQISQTQLEPSASLFLSVQLFHFATAAESTQTFEAYYAATRDLYDHLNYEGNPVSYYQFHTILFDTSMFNLDDKDLPHLKTCITDRAIKAIGILIKTLKNYSCSVPEKVVFMTERFNLLNQTFVSLVTRNHEDIEKACIAIDDEALQSDKRTTTVVNYFNLLSQKLYGEV